MTYSKITITFSDDLILDNSIGFKASIPNTSPTEYDSIDERWVSVRSGFGQVTIGLPTGILGERSAINFVTSFNLDHNNTSKYIVSRVDNVVTVESNIQEVDFSGEYSYDDYSEFPHALNGDVTFNVENYAGTFFSIDSVVFSEATTNTACTHYKVSVTTSELATQITKPNIVVDNTDNPYIFEILRGSGFELLMEAADGQTDYSFYNIPSVPGLLNSGYFDITVTSSPSGATVLITALQSFGNLVVEYSLDNSSWQTENQFTGLAEGDYILYVRDNLGCSFTEAFSVDAFGSLLVPYFKMPKENSIRFANRITWGDCANYKTDENSLSCESDVLKPYKEIQQFQTCDIITTQFNTGHSDVLAVVIKEDGTEVSHTVTKVTNYMDLKDKRDCRKYNLTDGKTGLYFTVGNIYDYDTGLDTGDDYILNGLLPEWAEVGTYVSIDAGWYLIEDIVFDESVNAQVVVITNTYTGVDVLTQVSVVYNLENFEEYEFIIDFVDYINETVQVRVNANDDVFTNIVQLSEDINVKVRHEGTLEIRYKNSKNTNINYSRGLENKLRLLVEKISGSPADESETNKTDTTARLIRSTVYELDIYAFSPVTKQMMRKILLALSHDTIMINGITYVKNDGIEVSDALEDTNLYDITATMIKGNNAFNSNVSQGSNAINSDAAEIPGLIESDSGYVSY